MTAERRRSSSNSGGETTEPRFCQNQLFPVRKPCEKMGQTQLSIHRRDNIVGFSCINLVSEELAGLG